MSKSKARYKIRLALLLLTVFAVLVSMGSMGMNSEILERYAESKKKSVNVKSNVKGVDEIFAAEFYDSSYEVDLGISEMDIESRKTEISEFVKKVGQLANLNKFLCSLISLLILLSLVGKGLKAAKWIYLFALSGSHFGSFGLAVFYGWTTPVQTLDLVISILGVLFVFMYASQRSGKKVRI
jgi:hypothetical protein